RLPGGFSPPPHFHDNEAGPLELRRPDYDDMAARIRRSIAPDPSDRRDPIRRDAGLRSKTSGDECGVERETVDHEPDDSSQAGNRVGREMTRQRASHLEP